MVAAPRPRAAPRGAGGARARWGWASTAGATFGDLSGGQRQRVLVARALVQDARVILLDEPFTGLDAPSTERLEELLGDLAGEGRGVMIATHDVDQARGWDSVLCLNRRQVAFGAPEATLHRAVLEATYAGEIVELPGGELRAVVPPHHRTDARACCTRSPIRGPIRSAGGRCWRSPCSA